MIHYKMFWSVTKFAELIDLLLNFAVRLDDSLQGGEASADEVIQLCVVMLGHPRGRTPVWEPLVRGLDLNTKEGLPIVSLAQITR